MLISKNPAEPGYINYYIGQLQRKKAKFFNDIRLLEGRIAGVDAAIQQIKEDTDASIIDLKKEENESQTAERQAEIKQIQKDVDNKSQPVPTKKKKKGVSRIEELAPPLEDEKPKKSKKKSVKRKNKG